MVGDHRASITCIAIAAALFVSRAEGAELPTAIFVMKVDGTEVRKVAEVDGYTAHRAPRFSPDGKHLVFSARKLPAGHRACFVVAIDGTDLREVGAGDMPDWSPDGKQIVYDDRGTPGEIIVQNLDGQGTSPIATGRSPRWSPDGRLLAFRRDDNVHVVDLISGDQRALLESPVYQIYSGMDWSPDGKQLAVIARTSRNGVRKLLMLVPDATGQLANGRLGIGIGGPIGFSPDGKQITYDFNFKIRIEDVDGKTRAQIVPGQKGNNLHPDWSPDGEWIAFGSDRHTVP